MCVVIVVQDFSWAVQNFSCAPCMTSVVSFSAHVCVLSSWCESGTGSARTHVCVCVCARACTYVQYLTASNQLFVSSAHVLLHGTRGDPRFKALRPETGSGGILGVPRP